MAQDAQAAALARLERLHAAQMAATMAALEDALTERGLGGNVQVSTGSAGPTHQGVAFDQTIARILGVTRAYFQRDLAARVPPQDGARPRRSSSARAKRDGGRAIREA